MRVDEGLRVDRLTLAFGARVILRDVSFEVRRGEIFVIMGESGCGKSTVLRALAGLQSPAQGEVYYDGVGLWGLEPDERQQVMRRVGMLYQRGALWSSRTLAENVALPLHEQTQLSAAEIKALVALKLALVGLAGFETFYPAELSGGMQKRAALARAIALDPQYLFFDEPSAGLDPLSSRRLDDLILELRDSLGATIVIVSHELASIFAIGDRGLFLDADRRTGSVSGDPRRLAEAAEDPKVRAFLTRSRPPEMGGR